MTTTPPQPLDGRYRFVTEEDIYDTDFYVPPRKGTCCGGCGVDWSRLLAERDAYREVAAFHANLFVPAAFAAEERERVREQYADEARKRVDNEARRLLEKESHP